MHYRLEPEAESACHDLRHERQSWRLHLHIHFRQWSRCISGKSSCFLMWLREHALSVAISVYLLV